MTVGKGPSVLRRKRGFVDNGYIVIAPRYLGSYGHDEGLYRRYLDSLAASADFVVSNFGLRVAIVAHTIGPTEEEDDRFTIHEVYALMEPRSLVKTALVDDDLSPAELTRLYGGARLVLATRFHAAVLSILAAIPVIAIPKYGYKTQGALDDLGLEDYVIELPSITSVTLITKVRDVLGNYVQIREKVADAGLRAHTLALDAARDFAPFIS